MAALDNTSPVRWPNISDNKKRLMLEKLEEATGIISTACLNANIGRSTFYDWKRDDKDFEAAVEEINDATIDFVESKLIEKVTGVTVQTFNSKGEPVIYEQPPSDTAIIFYLKCKGKKRGYIERQEITGADGKDLSFDITININK